jgi:hypothetical protein
MTKRCGSISLTGAQCTLPLWHGGLHRAPGKEWLIPYEQPICSRCGRRQSRHGDDGRDAQCPDGFAPLEGEPNGNRLDV